MRSALSTLFVASLVAVAAAQSPETGQLGNATVVSDNPVGVTYVGTLPEKEFHNPTDPRGNVKGSISATAAPDGVGVEFKVNFSNLPTSGGPFLYHIHVAPVPEDGNCTSTLAHQDPFIRGEATPCDASLPETCQVGDLSGKFGKITSDPFTASYVDDFASTKEGLGSFFGNRSFVVHFANKTRITCGNFAILGAETGGSQPNATTGYASPTASATSSPEFTGAAASVQVQGVRGIMASGFMAAAFMLFA